MLETSHNIFLRKEISLCIYYISTETVISINEKLIFEQIIDALCTRVVFSFFVLLSFFQRITESIIKKNELILLPYSIRRIFCKHEVLLAHSFISLVSISSFACVDHNIFFFILITLFVVICFYV